MSTLSLLVKDAPFITQPALRFAKAAHTQGVVVEKVFFFGRGVLHASDEHAAAWRALKALAGVRLILCSASAETFALAPDKDFEVEGLGELIEAGLSSHKVVSFG
jgi:sulfur relay (sulfurtransferase) complex TusBCD TusD component (DsrE family)